MTSSLTTLATMPFRSPISKHLLPNGELHQLALPGSEVYYLPDFYPEPKASQYFQLLHQLEGWEQRPIRVFGRECHQNRRTLYYGEVGTNYRYSGIDNPGDGKVPEVLREITRQVENYLVEHQLLAKDQHFNYWLGNYYSDGNHNIGMHSDDEPGLSGPIVSLSFGAPRYFDLKPRDNVLAVDPIRLNLEPGSLLIMTGETQKNYLHGVPTQKKVTQPRINLTLRMII